MTKRTAHYDGSPYAKGFETGWEYPLHLPPPEVPDRHRRVTKHALRWQLGFKHGREALQRRKQILIDRAAATHDPRATKAKRALLAHKYLGTQGIDKSPESL